MASELFLCQPHCFGDFVGVENIQKDWACFWQLDGDDGCCGLVWVLLLSAQPCKHKLVSSGCILDGLGFLTVRTGLSFLVEPNVINDFLHNFGELVVGSRTCQVHVGLRAWPFAALMASWVTFNMSLCCSFEGRSMVMLVPTVVAI
jgi:hypothetical protein